MKSKINNKITGKSHLVRPGGGAWSHVYTVMGRDLSLPCLLTLIVLSPQELEAEGHTESITVW